MRKIYCDVNGEERGEKMAEEDDRRGKLYM
jgi:hypothetical protein